MKKLFIFFLAVILVAFGAVGIAFYNADKTPIPTNIQMTADSEALEPSTVSWVVYALDDFKIFGQEIKVPLWIKEKFQINKGVEIDRMATEIALDSMTLKLEVPYGYEIVITDTDNNEVYKGTGGDVNFGKKGKFYCKITMKVPQGTAYKGHGEMVYNFFVDVNPQLKINFDKDNIKQGDLVRVEIENIFMDDMLEVKSDFKISNIAREEQKAYFYIPINYFKAAQRYDLDIIINGESFLNRYEVKEADFTVIRFTMDESVSSSTVNSAAANQEYREKIHPLYLTRSEEKYWSGAFIKPVQETKISSTFGQKRYVNNETTATRHSGIDYAAPQGTEIFAPARGKVEFAGFLQLSGNTIVIEHGLGLKSYYFHMNEVFTQVGKIVEQGEKIGEVGTTGYSTGNHLHFQVSIENQPINPEFLYNFTE